MNYVGLFEGISGFGLAFKRAGANITAVCEIDKTCQSVLRRHHPEAEIILDVKAINKNTFPSNSIDILAGGFPCQDLSVAGQRKGLAGERSGLWFEFLRIIGDHKPRWIVIENVPGLLSSNGGRDFAVILRGLAECGYFSAYRILDSQYDGVAQRRNRVFIVASLGTASCVEVLFERESSAWDSPPSREARERVAGNAIAGAVSSKWAKGTGEPAGDECYNLTVTPTIRSNGDAHSGFTTSDGLVIDVPEVVGTLDSGGSGAKGAHGGAWPGTTVQSASAGHCFPVAYNLTFCDANGRRADRPNDGLYVNETEQANTLTNGGQSGTVIAFAQNTRDEVRYINGDGQIAGALAAEAGMKQQSYVMAMQVNASDEVRTSDIAYTLNTNGNATGRNSPTIAGQFGVRRLTPTECERLQGFPEVENTAIIEICSDLLKSIANAESQNLKSPKPAGNVEKIESNQSAKCAELNLQPKHQPTKKPAQSDVRIFCEGGGMGIANQEKSLWFANNAEKQNWFLPSTKPEDFVQAIARICLIADRITKRGEAVFHQSVTCSITQENGSPLVRLSGNEITQPASDAREGLTTQNKPTKFITSNPSPATQNLEHQLITSCCSVVSAITGFIPKRTQSENSFRIEIRTKLGWTAFGHNGKPISDSARYRMLGNAVCVSTAEWIARRIMQLEAA